ncbi:hypothetical protein ACI3PL_25660, partial [Lacticaseibacillus paracasei]
MTFPAELNVVTAAIKTQVEAEVAGTLINIQTFSASGSWSSPTGAKLAFVEMWGGAGGGGGGGMQPGGNARGGGAGGGGGT